MVYGETFRFLRPSEVIPEPGELICRPSPWSGTAMMLIGACVAATAAWFWWREDTGWLVDIFFFLWLGFMWLVAYLGYRALRAALGPKSWLLRLRRDGLMIKFRSYLNAEKGVDDPTVVFIHFREISSADVVGRTDIVPDSDGGTMNENQRFLDIRLRDPARAAELEAHIADERKRFREARRAKAQFVHWPVNVKEGGVVRLSWRSRQDLMRPSLNKVAVLLARRLRVKESEQGLFDLKDLGAEARDARLRDMVARGDRIAAVKVLTEYSGMGLTEAMHYVDRLERA